MLQAARPNPFQEHSKMKIPATLAILAVAAVSLAQLKAVKVSATGQSAVKPGKVAILKVKFDVPAGYHIYGPKEKTGIPTDIKFAGPKGFTAKVLFPKTSVFKGVEGPSDVYFGSVTIPVSVSIPKSAKGKQSFKLKVTSQACNDRTCLPPATAELTVNTTVQ